MGIKLTQVNFNTSLTIIYRDLMMRVGRLVSSEILIIVLKLTFSLQRQVVTALPTLGGECLDEHHQSSAAIRSV